MINILYKILGTFIPKNTPKPFSFFVLFCLSNFWACVYHNQPQIQKKDLAYFVRRLSSDSFGGRLSGSPYAFKTASFLRDYYKRYGFIAAFESSYVHTFTFPAGYAALPHQNYVLFKPKFSKDKKEVKLKSLPLPLSLPAMKASVAGELVFAGYCLQVKKKWDDLRAVNLKNKIALCLRYGPGGAALRKDPVFAAHISFAAKYRKLKSKGVRGVLFLGKKEHPPPPLEAFSTPSKEGPPAVFIEPEVFLKYSKEEILGYNSQDKKKPSQNRGISLGRIRIKTALKKAQKHRGYNLGAYLYPPQAKQKLIVVGAHHDHLGLGHFASFGEAEKIHNGADDNASGTALVLELARALQADMKQKSSPKNERANVLFMHFDAEERGLLGSQAFVQSRYFQKLRTELRVIAMLNVDMVGRLDPKRGLQLQGAQTARAPWPALLKESFRRAAFPKKYKLQLVKGGYGPSDHSVFYERKIPVAFFSTGLHKQYHRPEDDFHRININGLYYITQMNRILIHSLWKLKKVPRFRG